MAIKKGLTAAILLEAILLCGVVAIGWRVLEATRAPLESERTADTRLAWIDLSGALRDFVDLPGRYNSPRLSLDGNFVSLTKLEPGSRSTWSLDLSTRQLRRVGSGQPRVRFELPSRDGAAFVFVPDEARNKLFLAANGRATRELFGARANQRQVTLFPVDWSSDSRSIAVGSTDLQSAQLWIVTRDGAYRSLVLGSHFQNPDARFSPDGKWLAFTSDQAGRDEVYVMPAAEAGSGAVRISRSGGHSPQWGRAAGELYYLTAGIDLVAVRGVSIPLQVAESQQPLRFSSLGGPLYEYAFDGYCAGEDPGRLLVLLRRIAGRP